MADERDQIAEAMLAAQLERNPAEPPQAWTQGVKNVMGGIMEMPKRAFGAAQQYTDTGQYNPAPIMEAATTAMTGGMPMAAKGAAGIFGGRLSMTANHPQLMRAEDMALDKQAPQRIWNETGWVQRPDRQWRYEIPDENAVLDQLRANYLPSDKRLPMGNIFHHRGAYEAYPEMKDLQFGHSSQLPQGTMGYFMPGGEKPDILRRAAGLPPRHSDPELVISAGLTPKDKRETILHEMQHVIQGKEGFALGGAPPSKIKLGTPEFEVFKELKRTFDPNKLEKMSQREFSDLFGAGQEMVTKEVRDRFTDAMRSGAGRDKAAETFAKREAYNRLLGESEARLTQKRSMMSPEELAKTFPTLDVPEKKMIIRMR